MSIRNYFKPTNKLPTAAKIGLPALAVKSANSAVTKFRKKELATPPKCAGGKLETKYTSTFTDEDHAKLVNMLQKTAWHELRSTSQIWI